MNPYITGITCTAIFLPGLWWQVAAFDGDSRNGGKRHEIALILSLVLFVGSIGYTIFAMIDSQVNMSLWGAIKFVGTGVLISIIFILKQAFGPVLISATAAWASYSYFQHGTMELLPLVRWLVQWLFSGSSANGSELFLWLTYGYALFGSISSSLD